MSLYLEGGQNCRDSRAVVGRAAAMQRGGHPCRCPGARDSPSRIATIDNKQQCDNASNNQILIYMLLGWFMVKQWL